MLSAKRFILPAMAGIIASLLLAWIYFGNVSLAESPAPVWSPAWENIFIGLPRVVGFGVPVTIPRQHLLAAITNVDPNKTHSGASRRISASKTIFTIIAVNLTERKIQWDLNVRG